MKVKTLSALAGIGSAMILSGSANAAFTGMSASLYSTTAPGVAGPTAKDVYRVYAMFDNAGDTLVTIFGDALGPFSVNLNGATPYNPGAGGNTPVGPTVLGSYPNVEWDSYATIGLSAGMPGTEAANAGLTLSPGFPNFLSASIPANTNFAYTTPGPVAQGLAGNYADNKVLIMQITVNAGQASPTGQVSLVYRPAGGGTGTDITLRNLTFAVPAPGALALLGVAGLVGARRRRA